MWIVRVFLKTLLVIWSESTLVKAEQVVECCLEPFAHVAALYDLKQSSTPTRATLRSQQR